MIFQLKFLQFYKEYVILYFKLNFSGTLCIKTCRTDLNIMVASNKTVSLCAWALNIACNSENLNLSNSSQLFFFINRLDIRLGQQLPFTTHFNSRYNHHTHIEAQIPSLTNTIFLTHKRHSTLDLMYTFIIQLILISNLAYLVSFSFYLIGNTLLFIFLKRYLTNRKTIFMSNPLIFSPKNCTKIWTLKFYFYYVWAIFSCIILIFS